MKVYVVIKQTRGEDNSAEIHGVHTTVEGARRKCVDHVMERCGLEDDEVSSFYRHYGADTLQMGAIVTEDWALSITGVEVEE